MVQAAPTGIEVKLDYFPLAFLYGLCPVYVIINGTEIKANWGTQFFSLAPGRYNVACYTHYLFFSRCGLNSLDVDVYPGTMVRINWTAPHFTFMKGSIWAQPPTPTTSQYLSQGAPGMPVALCGRCQAPLSPGAQACASCGTPVAWACPACGAPDTGGQVCQRCGHRLRT